MFNIALLLPKQNLSDKQQQITPDKVSKWLDKLNYSQNKEAQAAYLKTLKNINRLPFRITERIQLIDAMFPVSEKILAEQINQCTAFHYPLTKKQLELSNYIQSLLLEVSIAFKIIIKQISLNEQLLANHLHGFFAKACYQAMHALSCLLIERYRLYLPEPANIWLEINQIFLLSERLKLLEIPLESKLTIADQYKHISLIRIVDPYRLMRSEIRKFYELTTIWVDFCSIESIAGKDLTNYHVVDLSKDCPPGHILAVFHSMPEEARIINLGNLKVYIDKQLGKKYQHYENAIQSINSRLERDMLLRIKQQLSYLGEHREERILSNSQIQIVAGIHSCHYFMSNKKLFAADEEYQQFLDNSNTKENSQPSGLSLLAISDEELALEKKKRLNDLKKINPFISEDMIMDDKWDKIYLSSVVNSNIKESSETKNNAFKEERWELNNQSSGGMLLSLSKQSEAPLNVGILVAYRSETHENSETQSNYNLAIIRWLRINLKKGVTIGVMNLTAGFVPVAVKAIDGIGKGSAFSQALLNQKNTGDGITINLIISSGIYDLNSVLNIWHDNKITTVKIIQKTINTDTVMLVKCHPVHKELNIRLDL